jgi:SAM-dependent methyltransferase
MKKISKYLKILKCNSCNEGSIEFNGENYKCSKCNTSIKSIDNKLLFTKNYFDTKNWDNNSRNFQTLNYGKYLINKINGPKIKDLPKLFSYGGASINLGSGDNDYDNYLNIDLGNYDNVDIICNLEKLPFKDNSVSLVSCNSVFEHLKNPTMVMNEVKRILKPDGYFYLCVPFMCIRHHEIDYRRWTSFGLKKFLGDDFEIVETGACRSPVQSLISYVTAFFDLTIKNKIIKKTIFFLWKYLSAPLYLIKIDNSEHTLSLAQTIYVICKKK